MAADEIHVGDIGTVFTVTIQDGSSPVDISTATTKQFWLVPACGDTVAKPAEFVTSGTDGKLYYTTTLASDLDVPGKWQIQAYIVMPSGTWHSDVDDFVVHSNLPTPVVP